MSYFCIDTIANTLLNSKVKLESLYLKATRLDKMAAFYLIQSVIKDSTLHRLDLSSNTLLCADFCSSLEKLLIMHRNQHSLTCINLEQTGIGLQAIQRVSRLIRRNRDRSHADKSV